MTLCYHIYMINHTEESDVYMRVWETSMAFIAMVVQC